MSSLLSIGDLESLYSALRDKNIDTSIWVKSKFEELHNEMQNGDSHIAITPDGICRMINPAFLVIVNENKILKNTHNVFPDGSVSERNMLPAEHKKPGETYNETVLRLIYEEFQVFVDLENRQIIIGEIKIKFELDNNVGELFQLHKVVGDALQKNFGEKLEKMPENASIKVEEIYDSRYREITEKTQSCHSYPNLPGIYKKEFGQARVSGLPSKSFITWEEKHLNFWTWVDSIEEISKPKELKLIYDVYDVYEN